MTHDTDTDTGADTGADTAQDEMLTGRQVLATFAAIAAATVLIAYGVPAFDRWIDARRKAADPLAYACTQTFGGQVVGHSCQREDTVLFTAAQAPYEAADVCAFLGARVEGPSCVSGRTVVLRWR